MTLATVSGSTHRRAGLLSVVALLAVAVPPTAMAGAKLATVESMSATSVQVTFNRRVSANALGRAKFYVVEGLTIARAVPGADGKSAMLFTSEQDGKDYFLLIKRKGGFKGLKKNSGVFAGIKAEPVEPPVVDEVRPLVVGARALDNTTILVTFSEPMGPSAEVADAYRVTQENVNPEVGALPVTKAVFADAEHMAVRLTTASQSELKYRVTAVDCRDVAGNPMDNSRSLDFIDSSVVFANSALFTGLPAGGAALIDSDGDGLSDDEELRGHVIAITKIGGQVEERQVTSDPQSEDTDLDGLPDGLEKSLDVDPRRADSDGDGLKDYQEFWEIFSDGSKQDTDGDKLFDGFEFTDLRQSPNFKDTDGDQLPDDQEVLLAPRNPRASDLPRPEFEIGDVDLQLDVRFTATSESGTRELESKTARVTLAQTEEKKSTRETEQMTELGVTVGIEHKVKAGVPESGTETTLSAEASYTGQNTQTIGSESRREAQNELENTRQTDAETTTNETVERHVEGALMAVAVTLRGVGNVAFRVRNLQLTAFMQDFRDVSRLVPVATLVPDAPEPDGGYALGPLVPERGPFLFKNDQIFPAQVERLLADPRGLVFRLSNYDLESEDGRNFAFTSQEINDRTGALVIDYGAADLDGDGEGETTERYRISTAGGRVIDTNHNGTIDAGDRRAAFFPSGAPTGITLEEALVAVLGFTKYREEETPSSTLSDIQLDKSFSTKVVNGVETLWRMRRVSRDETPQKLWLVLDANGYDATIAFGQQVLLPNGQLTVGFYEDLDDDGVNAVLEDQLGCSDKLKDTDGDGLDDDDEAFVGWTVDLVGRGTYRAYGSCASTDSDRDGLDDLTEATRTAFIDVDGDGQPDDFDGDGVPDAIPAHLDARNPDTDGDGVSDFEEINGYTIEVFFPDADDDGTPDGVITVTTNPLDADTDGDLVNDGDERRLGSNPTKIDRTFVVDDDGDGLRNVEEERGWTVTIERTSTTPGFPGPIDTCTADSFAGCGVAVTSDPLKKDTDGDGLDDPEERTKGTHPRLADTDGDGIEDAEDAFPLDADHDDDLRSDGAELKIPIVVQVAGKPAKQVFSDPAVADADLDGLVDGQEAALGTDPTDADTDDDGFLDGAEVTAGSNPLSADQRLRIRVSRVKVTGDCDDGSNGSDQFLGKIILQQKGKPAQTVLDLYDRHCTVTGDVCRVLGPNGPEPNDDGICPPVGGKAGACTLNPSIPCDNDGECPGDDGVDVCRINECHGLLDTVPEGASVDPNVTRDFILTEGDFLSVFGEGFCEQDDNSHDGTCSGSDDQIQGFQQTLSFPIDDSLPIDALIAFRSGSCGLEFTLEADDLGR